MVYDGRPFHLEATADLVAPMLLHDGDELVPSPTIQSDASIKAVDAAHCVDSARLMGELLSILFAPTVPRN